MENENTPNETAQENKDTPNETTQEKKRLHRATYAADKRNGGYLIRVAGPYAEKFASREVPVSLRSGNEQKETLVRLVWAGADERTSEKVALYTFAPKPREEQNEVQF